MRQLSIIFLFLAIPVVVCAQSVTGTWSTAPSTGLTARSDFATAAVGGKIYVIGGRNGNTNVSTMNVYDPTTDTWSTPTTTGTFTPRWGLGAAVVGGNIYVMGGVNSDLQRGMSTLEVFDPSTNTWSTPQTTGTLIGRNVFGTAVVNGLIYVMGGYNGAVDPSTNQVFDPTTNTWNVLTASGTFTARDGLTACAVGNKIYAIAGIVDDFSNTLQVLDLSTNTWSTPATTGWLTTRSNGASDVIDGKIYVVGGTNDTLPIIGGVQVFDPATNAWSTAVTTDTVIPRKDLGAVTLDGRLYVIGGLKRDSIFTEYSKDVQYFTPAASSVSAAPSFPSLTLAPNPTDGMVTIGGIPSGVYEVKIANDLGENVLPVHRVWGPNTMLDLSSLVPGSYFVTLHSALTTVTEKIVKR